MEKTAEDYLFVPDDYFRRLRLEEIFAGAVQKKPLEVDLGAGDGTFLVEMAAHYPERNFLGVERLLGRARKICRKAARRELKNVRVLRLESAYTVEWLLPRDSVSRIHLLFPDPWPKKKHRRRRLVSREFIEGMAAVLCPGGEFCFKTDHAEYDEMVREELARAAGYEVVSWPGEDEFYAETDFEKQWKGEGREIRNLRAVHR